MRSRIFVKLMLVFLVVIAVTAVTLLWTVHSVWERTLHQQIERDLTQKVQMFAYRVENDRQHSLADITSQEGQAAGARATVIDPTGKHLNLLCEIAFDLLVKSTFPDAVDGP